MNKPLLLALGLSFLVGCGSTATRLSHAPDRSDHDPVVAADPNDPRATPVAVDGPSANGPWIGAAAANDAMTTGAQDTFVAVWVDVPNTSAKVAQAPAAVALVIDTSGSMQGAKIENARRAALELVKNLRDGDIVSIHTFSDAVEERVAPTRLDARSRERIAGVVSELRANGGTNLFEGVRTAGLAAMSAPASHAVRRVVLISDGNATVGTTSTEMIGFLGEKAGDRNVQITSIGVGLDYNENALNQLAIKSSGRLYHLTEPRNLPEIIDSEVALLKSTRASNAKVAIVPAPGVQLTGIEGARGVTVQNGAIEVPLGSMFAGQHREFVVRARVSSLEAGSVPIASVRLVFSDPTEGNLERVQEALARVDVVSDPVVAAARKNAKAQGVLAMLEASKATSFAAVAMQDERFDDADQRLAETEKNLRALAQAAKDKGDRERFEASAGKVSQARAGAAAAAAAPAPARAEAKRKASLEANDAAMDLNGL